MTCARNVPSPTLTKAGSDMSVVSVRGRRGVDAAFLNRRAGLRRSTTSRSIRIVLYIMSVEYRLRLGQPLYGRNG